ncbi:MAG: hypothetical protein ACK4R9_04225 [Ignavibacterium sp.]
MQLKNSKLFILFLFLIITISISIYNNIILKYEIRTDSNKLNFQSLNNLIKSDSSLANKNIIIFLDITDFSCTNCERSVVSLSKVLANTYNQYKSKIILLAKIGWGHIDYHKKLITDWINNNNIKLNFQLDENYIFKKADIKKTSIVILDKKIVFYKEFPLSRIEIDKIINIVHPLLKNNDHAKNGLD